MYEFPYYKLALKLIYMTVVAWNLKNKWFESTQV